MSANVEEFYSTLLESLVGFDPEELENMDEAEVRARWNAAAQAFADLDAAMRRGAPQPMEWREALRPAPTAAPDLVQSA